VARELTYAVGGRPAERAIMTAAMAAVVAGITTREARLEDALRHARGIVAAEVAELRAQLRTVYQALNPSDRTATDPDIAIWASARPRHNSGRQWAQIAERERWIAAWDAALAPAAAPTAPAPDVQMLVDALRLIRNARDYYAAHGEYQPDAGPGRDQCFDDWTADLVDQALTAAGVPPEPAIVESGQVIASAEELAAFVADVARERPEGGACDIACDNCREAARRENDPTIESECIHDHRADPRD